MEGEKSAGFAAAQTDGLCLVRGCGLLNGHAGEHQFLDASKGYKVQEIASPKPAGQEITHSEHGIMIDKSRTVESLQQYYTPENLLFCREYRQLKPEEGALIRAIKDQAAVLHGLMQLAPTGRDQRHAQTHLEDSVMRVVRAITG